MSTFAGRKRFGNNGVRSPMPCQVLYSSGCAGTMPGLKRMCDESSTVPGRPRLERAHRHGSFAAGTHDGIFRVFATWE